MPVQRERVHGEGEAEEIQQLVGVADAVRAPEPHGVVEVTVDGLRVVTTREEPFEGGIARRDRSEVLGPVQLPCRVFVVAVQPNRDRLVSVLGRERVIVVPAISAVLAGVAVGAGCGRVRRSVDRRYR